MSCIYERVDTTISNTEFYMEVNEMDKVGKIRYE